jgi:hypothetical protein
VIAAIVEAAVVIAPQATNQTSLIAPVATQLTPLIARQTTIRAKDAPLVANRPATFAQQTRLITRNLT